MASPSPLQAGACGVQPSSESRCRLRPLRREARVLFWLESSSSDRPARGGSVGIILTAANVNEHDVAYDVLSAIEKLVLGNKSYIRPQFKADCEALGTDLQTPVRRNMNESQ